MNGNVGTTWAASATTLEERVHGGNRYAGCFATVSGIACGRHAFGNGGMEKPTEPTAGRGLSRHRRRARR